jgi:microcystin-dependent protein
MSADPFVGEIHAVPYSFAPRGWALCDGQLMPISQNTALFSLLGTTYGGDGKSTFALPNLQGCSPIFWGQGPGLSPYYEGQTGGETAVTLLQSEMPTHAHGVNVVDAPGTQNSPQGALLGKARFGKAFDLQYASSPANGTAMHSGALAVAGGGQPHNNMPPYLVVTFIIALQGIFPPRS